MSPLMLRDLGSKLTSCTAEGAFSRGGTLFFSILFLGWLQLSELMKAVSGRAIIARHDDYAFYRPSAVVIARVIQDFPMLLVQVIPFSLVMYFLTGLVRETLCPDCPAPMASGNGRC